MKFLPILFLIFLNSFTEYISAQVPCLLNDIKSTQRSFKELPENNYELRENKADTALQLGICYRNDSSIIWKVWMLISIDLYKSSIVGKGNKYNKKKANLNYKIGLCYYYLHENKRSIKWLSNAIKLDKNLELPYYFLAHSYFEIKNYSEAIRNINTYIDMAENKYKSLDLIRACESKLKFTK